MIEQELAAGEDSPRDIFENLAPAFRSVHIGMRTLHCAGEIPVLGG